jgi:hypothetical protein
MRYFKLNSLEEDQRLAADITATAREHLQKMVLKLELNNDKGDEDGLL